MEAPCEIPESAQRMWLDALAERWATINRKQLDGTLRPPTFELIAGKRALGRWDPSTRTLSVSVEHLLADSWIEVEETLRHEMAHQVVSELWRADGAPPHGGLFERASTMLGVSHSPRRGGSLDAGGVRILERVRKLMNLSQSSNLYEAQAAAAAANRLLLKYNLTLAESASDVSYRWLGRDAARITSEQRLLASILGTFYFVRCIWIRTQSPATGKRRVVLEVHGRRVNLDIAQYVYQTLCRRVDALWAEYRTTERAGRADRRSYRVGVLMGFWQQLESDRQAAVEEGMVWLGDPAVQELLSQRHPRTRRLNAGSYRPGEAHTAGVEAGRSLRVRDGLADRPASTGVPKKLGE